MQNHRDNSFASIDLSFRENQLFRPLDLTDFATHLNLRVRQAEALRWVRGNVFASTSRRSSMKLLKIDPGSPRDFGE